MKAKWLLSVAFVFLAVQTACYAQKAIAEADAYVASVREFVEKQGEPHLILADVSDYNQGSDPKWKKYLSVKEFENLREEEESYTIAYVWLKDGKPVAVNFTYSSPSGDWAHYAEHVFRPGGSVAEIKRELRTFLGDLIVIRTSLFDENGNELRNSKEFLDLSSHKPVEPTDEFQDIDVDVYKKVSDLPFSELLSVSGKQ